MSKRPPLGLQPDDARWLVMYLGIVIGIFTALGLAWAFPRLLPLVILGGILGAYLLARLVASFRSG